MDSLAYLKVNLSWAKSSHSKLLIEPHFYLVADLNPVLRTDFIKCLSKNLNILYPLLYILIRCCHMYIGFVRNLSSYD